MRKHSMRSLATGLCAGIAFALAPQVGLAGNGYPDHLQCFGVGDSGESVGVKVDLASMFPYEYAEGCKVVGKARRFCTWAAKYLAEEDMATKSHGGEDNVVGSTVENGAEMAGFLCYDVRCPKREPTEDYMYDQFGERLIELKQTQRLCAPARLAID